MTLSRLKQQIYLKERRIEAKKRLIHQNYQQLKNNVCKEITSPSGLLLAFALGFVLTYQYTGGKFPLPKLTDHLLTAKNLFMLLA